MANHSQPFEGTSRARSVLTGASSLISSDAIAQDPGTEHASMRPVSSRTSWAEEHRIAQQALISFDKFDRDGNGFLSELEIQHVAAGAPDQEPLKNAAKYMQTNYYVLKNMNKSNIRGGFDQNEELFNDYGLSKNDLNLFQEVTAPNFNAREAASRQAWDHTKGGLEMGAVLSLVLGACLTKYLGPDGFYVTLGTAGFGAGLLGIGNVVSVNRLTKHKLDAQDLLSSLKRNP